MTNAKRVTTDAGRGDEEPGIMYDRCRGGDDALRLALAIGQILEGNGIGMVYTRTMDMYDTPLERAQIAGQSGADYLVFIHRNAFPVSGGASGAMTLVCQDVGVPAILADNIQRDLMETGFRDLGVRERPGLIVPWKTQMPVILAEVRFTDNPEGNWFFDESFDAIARIVADGVLGATQQQEAKRPGYYQTRVGAFRIRTPVDRLMNRLQANGLPAFLVYGDGLYKVRVGAFPNMGCAVRVERNLRNTGYPTVLARERVIY